MKSITADSLTGAVFALEGMRNAVVLLNGPMGCRFYHSTTSRFLMTRPLLKLPAGQDGTREPVDYNTLNDWFFRQERVPCTCLDGYDYVYGTKEKVREALTFIRDSVDLDLLAIVNSPGACLIGDDLKETARSVLGGTRTVMVESPGLSSTFEEGWSRAATALLEQTGTALWRERMPEKRKGKRVNLLGLSVWQRYFEGDLAELKRLFALCGAEVTAALCADCSVEELARMPEADLNVVLDPAAGTEAARYLERVCGTPFAVFPGFPVGFSATERMFEELGKLLGTSCEALLEESGRARALAWYKIEQVYATSGKPRGVTFFVGGSAAQKRAYESFLTKYLGMEPSDPERAELVFGDANLISELMLKNRRFCGIEISLPGMGYIDLVPKTHMGIRGALFLIEQVLNGLMSRLQDE
ncbi:MAG: oxidoreductase [Oscillospiraceae bacterium]|nr:oxidoreductase [Oscillospiraceae bacterium]